MAILLALGCALVYGVADYCGGRATRAMRAIGVTLIGQTVSLALIGLAVLLDSVAAPGASSWWWGLGGGVAGALGLTCFYSALSAGVMTVVAPTTAVVAVSIPIVVGLSDGERPGMWAYIGIGLAVVAIALVSGALSGGDRSGSGSGGGAATRVPSRVLGLSVVAGLGFGILFVCLGRAGDDSGLWPLLAVRLASVSLLGAVWIVVRGRRRTLELAQAEAIPADLRPQAIRLAIVAGVLDMAANVLYLLAVRRGDLSVVGVVSSLYPVSTTVLAFGLDGERVSRWQAIGMGLAAAAVVMVSISAS